MSHTHRSGQRSLQNESYASSECQPQVSQGVLIKKPTMGQVLMIPQDLVFKLWFKPASAQGRQYML